MSSKLAMMPREPLTMPPLSCVLRRPSANNARGDLTLTADVEITNISTVPIDIEYHLTPLQGLNLIVHDCEGKVVSEGHYADRFSPTLEARILQIKPGESYRANVHLFATAPNALQVPGTYSIQAIYEYDTFRAESDIVSVTV